LITVSAAVELPQDGRVGDLVVGGEEDGLGQPAVGDGALGKLAKAPKDGVGVAVVVERKPLVLKVAAVSHTVSVLPWKPPPLTIRPGRVRSELFTALTWMSRRMA
jgi:hypothetical protein